MLLLHPSEARLNRFADGELGAGRRARVAQHLLRCERCRGTVNAIRLLGRAARDLSLPALGIDVKSRVLSSVHSGAQVIVPIADPPRRVWQWPRVVQAGAGVLVVAVVLALLIDPGALRSEASSLEFEPQHPLAGSQVTVAYRATRLASHHRLRLRALYRRADDPQHRPGVGPEVVAWLERDPDGLFKGSFSIPPAAVYGLFAVEDDSGWVVDGRGRTAWEFLAVQDRKPSYDALLQKSYEAADRDVRVALDAAIRATEVDPDRVEAWLARSFFEQQAFGDVAHDSLHTFHAAQLRRLNDVLRAQSVSPAVASAMYFYAGTWDEHSIAAEWRERLLREAPRSPAAVQLRTVTLRVSHVGAPARALDAFERLWREAGTPHEALPREALKVALDAGRSEDARRWAGRWLELQPWARRAVAEDLLDLPGSEAFALTLVTSAVQTLRKDNDATRPLYQTLAEHQAQFERERRDLLGLTGRVLLRMGHTRAARAYLDSAAVDGWDTGLFVDLAAARLAAGDTMGSAEMLARVAVDPGYQDITVRSRVLSLVDSSSWAGMLTRAREHLIAVTRAEARPLALDRRAELVDEQGSRRDLHSLAQGQVTIVAFFWPPCITCLDDLEQLVRVRDHASVPTRLLLVAETAPSTADLERLRARGIDAPVLTDPWRQAAEAVGVRGSPSYFVLDRHATVQYADASLHDVARQVDALGASAPVLF